jgi:hypothetical protein
LKSRTEKNETTASDGNFDSQICFNKKFNFSESQMIHDSFKGLESWLLSKKSFDLSIFREGKHGKAISSSDFMQKAFASISQQYLTKK